MAEVSKVVVRAGLVDSNVVSEFKRWGSLTELPDAAPIADKDVPSALEQAMQDEGYARVRETDLETLQLYLRTQRPGVIHFEPIQGEPYEFAISYGVNRFGQFIIPWTEQDITELMTNGATFLVHEGREVFMKDARELFYGEKKAFIVCTPDVDCHERG
jgi:hypothetical protein